MEGMLSTGPTPSSCLDNEFPPKGAKTLIGTGHDKSAYFLLQSLKVSPNKLILWKSIESSFFVILNETLPQSKKITYHNVRSSVEIENIPFIL